MEIEVLRALAHPIRLGIVRRLATQAEICACDFIDEFAVSQPTISAHLRVLREAGLVTTRRQGTTICYALAREPLFALTTELGTLQGNVTPVRL